MKNVAYEAVYNQIMTAMENGDIPWRKPWKTFRPRNAKTNREYSGVNFFILTSAGASDSRWLTFNQLKEMGGTIKKGAKSKQIVFWSILKKEIDGKAKSIPLLKYFNVFNVDQCEGLELEPLNNIDIKPNIDADKIMLSYATCPKIVNGEVAAYSVSLDEIKMPVISNFDNTSEFYATLYHEAAHSTGHKDRLNRKTITQKSTFGDNMYSEEELIAEFTSAFLCAEAGIDNTIENSAAYIKGWMKAFKDNPEMIVNAASKAQKAANYILGRNYSEGE